MNEPLIGDKLSCFKKHWITILVTSLIIIAVTLTVVLVVVLRKDKSKDESKKEDQEPIVGPFQILLNDTDFIKPKIKLNAEFQLVKTKTDMIGLLINDPFAEFSTVYLYMPNGSYTETVPGLAHFGEHMVSGGSEKYPNIVPVYNPIIGGVIGGIDNAETSGTFQSYYMQVPFNFLFENVIDLLMDSFRYPFYDKNVVKKEIQPVNSEFYLGENELGTKLGAILQQLSSNKTSFNGMLVGNNETLNPDDYESLAKKLRGYHSLIKKPDNIFFSLFSNESMKTLENYTEKYFTYKMHEFTDNEIDKEDIQKLKQNAENIIKYDIFDEKLYSHGFYFDSKTKSNVLSLIYNLGDINYKDLQFEAIEYIHYLFNSKYLKDYMVQKEYLLDYDFEKYAEIKNNNIISITMVITNKAVENLNEFLLIIYKFIELIKIKGYEKKYFEDFIKLKRNKQALEFNKNSLKNINSFLQKSIRNYRIYGKNQIFTDGTPLIENYDENKIKEFLNKFKYEKSFFGLNTNSKFSDYQSKTFLESPEIRTLKYYKTKYLYGKIPDDFKTQIEQYNNENIKMREISQYFSEKYESVVPCYKDTSKNCTELNEFNYLNEDEYAPIKLDEENDNYKTYYQIDKSSESHIVHSFLEIKLIESTDFITFIMTYLQIKITEIDELNSINIVPLDDDCLSIEITSFSDNTEKIINALLNLLKFEPNQNDILFLKNNVLSNLWKSTEKELSKYTIDLYTQFIKGKKSGINIDERIKMIDEIINSFTLIYKENFINSIKNIVFKIAGNINKDLVQNIHNSIKNNLKTVSNNKLAFNQQKLLNEEKSFIINYYQKSELIDVSDNAIYVRYNYELKYHKVMFILAKCMDMEAIPLLRFNFSNAYSPKIGFGSGFLIIFEQGKYKEVNGMEDDINEVLNMLINGTLKCPNYQNIVKSNSLKSNGKIEKDHNYLFEQFKNKEYTNINKIEEVNQDYIPIPNTFKELVEIVSPIFMNPQRFTILVVRPGISDDDFKKLIEKRKENYKYKLNESIVVEHSDDISYWVNRNQN